MRIMGIPTIGPAVPERSGSTSEELRENLQHKPTEPKNKNQNEGHEEVQSDLSHDLLDWLQDFNPALKDRDTSKSSIS